MLLRYFDVGGIELPITVWLQNTEDVPDDLLLPVDQLKGLTVPGAFGVTAELFDEAHRVIGGILIVVAVLRHEAGRLIMFQFSYHRHKKQPLPRRVRLSYYEQQPRRAVCLFV